MKIILNNFFIIFFQLLLTQVVYPTDKINDIYEKPKTFDFIKDVPATLKESWDASFNTRKETLIVWGGIAASSTLFYIYDENIYKHARIIGRKIGLGNEDHTKPMLTIGGVNLFRGPTDTGSAIHFIGDGWLQFAIASGFAINGSISDDNRMLQTGSQIMNSLISGSIPTQLLKRATGREDPNRASRYRGRWKPFSKNYDTDVSAYDAVPSGHLMAAASTLTVIDANYPEYKSIIRPVGLSLLTLLSLQLANIGVHWASDYPLALGIGYVFGITASKKGKIGIGESKSTSTIDFHPFYQLSESNVAHNLVRTYGVSINLDF